jgi:hypothetical protein
MEKVNVETQIRALNMALADLRADETAARYRTNSDHSSLAHFTAIVAWQIARCVRLCERVFAARLAKQQLRLTKAGWLSSSLRSRDEQLEKQLHS